MQNVYHKGFLSSIILLSLLVFPGCGEPKRDFVILSSPEHGFLEEHVISFGKKYGVRVRFIYRGDPEIAACLSRDDLSCDAVWPLHRIWLDIGDDRGRVTGDRSIMYSPVAAGVDENLVRQQRAPGIKLMAQSGSRIKLPSFVRSGSGAVAGIRLYEIFQKAPPGKKLPFTWLNGKNSHGSETIITTEAEILAINRSLVKKHKPPRLILYLDNVMLIADSPLGLFRKRKKTKGVFFTELKKHLLSKEMQKFIIDKGRRSVLENHLKIDARDFPGAQWINRNRRLTPSRLPVEKEFLKIFKTILTRNKKVSRCALLLDFSQSMKEGGRDSIMNSLVRRIAFSSGPVRLYEPAKEDRLIFIPFSHLVRDEFETGSSEGASLSSIVGKLAGIEPRGATSFYGAILHGLEKLKDADRKTENVSVLLVTDGSNNTGIDFKGFIEEYQQKYPGIPVHVLYFENADYDEIKKITDLTGGTLFKGTGQVDETLRTILGYQ